MENPILNYKLLNAMTSKKLPQYKILHDLLKQQAIIDKLTSRNINVVESIDEDYNKFKLSLYNCDMSLIMSYNDINENMINEIISVVDKLPENKKQHGGGNKNYYKEQFYRYKYNKYKTKYKHFKKDL